MRPEASKLMTTRAASPTLTQTSIRSTATGRDSRAVRLIDTIFGFLPAVFDNQGSWLPQLDSQKGDTQSLSPIWIAKEFYTKHFCNVVIKRDYAGAVISLEEFISEITFFETIGQRNKVFFLQGEIGTGKSALINHIISKYGKVLFGNGVWFLRLNVDIMRIIQGDAFSAFFEAFEEKFLHIVDKLSHTSDVSLTKSMGENLAAMHKRHRNASSDTRLESRQQRLKKNIAEVSKIIKKNCLLIIDNTDYIVHDRDRYQFLKNKQEIDDGYLMLIRRIVASFYVPGSSLSDIGANVMFVVRPDTYHLLKTSNKLVPMFRIPFVDNRYLFSLNGPSWDEVVSQRAELLKSCVDKIQPLGVADEVRRHTEPLIQTLQSPQHRERLFRHLREISVFGLRGVLNFFGDYTWYPASNPEAEATVTTRFLKSYQLGLIVFMLGSKVIFTQNDANFPNLFFSNINGDEEDEEIVAPRNVNKTTRRVSRDHWATYWLKRLLLEFIKARNISGMALKPDDIYDVFCAENNNTGYTEDIVRLCLGSFSQTHLSDLIVVSREITGDGNAVRVENISLSARARHCLNQIFDTFPYLQLVVDDYLMPLPRRWVKEFIISEERTYRYLTAPNSEFVEGARSMVAFKALRVTQFLALLKVALSAERVGKPQLFQTLLSEGVNIPNVDRIFGGVINELSLLNSSGGSSVDIERLKEMFESCEMEIHNDIFAAYGI